MPPVHPHPSVPLASVLGPTLPTVTLIAEPLGLERRRMWLELHALARAEPHPLADALGIGQAMRPPPHRHRRAHDRVSLPTGGSAPSSAFAEREEREKGEDRIFLGFFDVKSVTHINSGCPVG